MARRGPKPKPDNVVALGGDAGKRLGTRQKAQKSFAVENSKRAAVPECPDFLGEIATAEWHRMVAYLEPSKLLHLCDEGLLAAWCEAYEEFAECTKLTRERGRTCEGKEGAVYQAPWVGQKNQAVKRMREIAAEFGFSPSARVRVPHPDADPAEDAVTQFFA